MKSNYLKAYIVEIIFLIYIFCIYYFKLFNVSGFIDNLNIIFFLLIGIVSYFLYGFSKCRKLTKNVSIQVVIIWVLIYYFITYISGLFFGFLKGPYALNFISIFKNLLPSIILIVLQEIVRYMYIRVNEKKILNIIIFTILFILFDIVMGLHYYGISTLDSLMKTIGLLVLPSISREFLFSYLSVKGGYKPIIIYKVLQDTLIYILPIVPDLSVYFEAVIKFSFPVLVFLSLDRSLEKYERKKSKKIVNTKAYITIPIIFILFVLVSLVSGIFKYYLIAIGSGSMEPVIKVGDAVIIEKVNSSVYSSLEEGEILAFRADNKMIVHRIKSIEVNGDYYKIVTKGDANKNEDKYEINDSNIVGVVKVKIPYIGLPSVWLNNLFS